MEQHGPWQIKCSEIKYKNNWMEVREDQVVRPDGKDGIFGVVTKPAGVYILAYDGSHVYLTEEFKYGIGRPSIEAAAGGVERGETPDIAAARELKEELGITAAHWTSLGTIDPLTQLMNSPMHLYLAQDLTFGEQALDDTETIKIVKMSFDESVAHVMNGVITNASTCVLILKAKEILGR